MKSPTDVHHPPYPWIARIFIPIFILGAIAALLITAGHFTVSSARVVRIAPVVQKAAMDMQLSSAIVQAAGWIEPDPFEIAVSALADGIVEEVLVLESEVVHKGQTLVRLVDDDARLELRQAEAELALAEAELKAAKAELSAAETDWANPVELDRATAASQARLAEMQAKLTQIDAEIKAEEAIAEEAERAFRRVDELLRKDKVGTQAEVDAERARFLAQTAKVGAKRSEYKTVLASIAAEEAEVRAATERLRLRTQDKERLEKAEAMLAQAEATLEVAMVMRDIKLLQLKRMEIRSPADGVVMRRLTTPGTKVVRMMDNPQSSHVAHLYDPNQLQVRVDVALADAALIHIGQKAEISVEAFPNKIFNGVVARVTHEANIQKNTIEVQVAISDLNTGLRPEMLARVKFLSILSSGETRDEFALYAPRQTVLKNDTGAFVFAVDDVSGDRGIASWRQVETLGLNGKPWVQILSGVKLGDRLVHNPPADLKDGDRVRVLSELADEDEETISGTD